MTMLARITTLTDKESRTLREVDRLIAEWTANKPFSNREQPAWDMCESILASLAYIRDEILLCSETVQ